MKLNNKQSLVAIILLCILLITLNYISEPLQVQDNNGSNDINPVGQADIPDMHITADDIKINDTASINDNISVEARVTNFGDGDGEQVTVKFYLERDDSKTEIYNITFQNFTAKTARDIKFQWQIPTYTTPGDYNFVVSIDSGITRIDPNPGDNEASRPISIKSILDVELPRSFAYPGKKLRITLTVDNREAQQLNGTIDYYYYIESEGKKNSTLFNQQTINLTPSIGFVIHYYTWELPKNLTINRYILWFNLSNSSDPDYKDSAVETKLNIIKFPDTTKTPSYLQTWFIVGLIALIIFFLTIIFSLIGVIPQDRLPIQPALVVMALVIMVIALIGHTLDPEVHLIGAQDIAGMVIIHPITALTAGFLVAGGLEAAGAFAAAADALGRIEKLKIKGFTIFGFTGTVVILTNIPTLIAMPCGRILGAALMPAALFFGYRLAKAMGDARMVGVVVFSFIVNAAASCGPSPLGGIGTIGEGLSKMPIGSFTTAQSTGIMICTGVCALFMRFITFMRPADLSDEDIKREKEAEAKAGKTDAELEEAPPTELKSVQDDKEKEKSKTGTPVATPVASVADAKAPPVSALAKPVQPAKPVEDAGEKTAKETSKLAAPVAKKVDDK